MGTGPTPAHTRYIAPDFAQEVLETSLNGARTTTLTFEEVLGQDEPALACSGQWLDGLTFGGVTFYGPLYPAVSADAQMGVCTDLYNIPTPYVGVYIFDGVEVGPVYSAGGTLASPASAVSFRFINKAAGISPLVVTAYDSAGAVLASVTTNEDGIAAPCAERNAALGFVDSYCAEPPWTWPELRLQHPTDAIARFELSGQSGQVAIDKLVITHLTISYQFTGFLAPVDNQPTVNRVKAGRAVPVKFSLGGDRGLDIFLPGHPVSRSVPCGGDTADVIEQTVTASASGLHYDTMNQTYTYVWKTSSSWEGSCRNLVLGLRDGSTRQASFEFR